MESYYCEFCNKNVEIETKIKLVCKDCGFLLTQGNLTAQEIEKRNAERKAYCIKCGKPTYNVPIQSFINAYSRERDDRIKNLKYNIPKRNLYLCFFIVFMIPFIILLVVATYGLILLAIVVLIVLYFVHIKNKKIKEINEDTRKIISAFEEDQKKFEFACSVCGSGVSLRG